MFALSPHYNAPGQAPISPFMSLFTFTADRFVDVMSHQSFYGTEGNVDPEGGLQVNIPTRFLRPSYFDKIDKQRGQTTQHV